MLHRNFYKQMGGMGGKRGFTLLMDINRNVLFLNKCYSIKSLVIPMDRRWEPGVPDQASVHMRFNARPCVFRVLFVCLLCHCEWYAFSDRFVEPELNKVAEITAQVCTNSAEYIKRYRFVFAQFRHRSRSYADGFSEGHRADVHVDEQFPHFTIGYLHSTAFLF